MDFKKACDTVMKHFLYNNLIQFGIPMKLVRLTWVLKQGGAVLPLLSNFAWVGHFRFWSMLMMFTGQKHKYKKESHGNSVTH